MKRTRIWLGFARRTPPVLHIASQQIAQFVHDVRTIRDDILSLADVPRQII